MRIELNFDVKGKINDSQVNLHNYVLHPVAASSHLHVTERREALSHQAPYQVNRFCPAASSTRLTRAEKNNILD